MRKWKKIQKQKEYKLIVKSHERARRTKGGHPPKPVFTRAFNAMV
jgi:hypothetical protein